MTRPVYVLHLRAEPGVDPTRALRALLKAALRTHRLRCIAIRAHRSGRYPRRTARKEEARVKRRRPPDFEVEHRTLPPRPTKPPKPKPARVPKRRGPVWGAPRMKSGGWDFHQCPELERDADD